MPQHRVAVVGIHEFPSRNTRGTLNALQIKARCAARALDDAGLTWSDIDALYDDGDGIMWPGFNMPQYFDLDLKVIDTTAVGGSSFEVHVGHALRDLSSGRASVALLTYGAVAHSSQTSIGTGAKYSEMGPPSPISNMEDCWGPTLVSDYGQFARRYMHDHGTRSEQLAEIAVTARYHALRNPEAVQAILDLRPARRAEAAHRRRRAVIADDRRPAAAARLLPDLGRRRRDRSRSRGRCCATAAARPCGYSAPASRSDSCATTMTSRPRRHWCPVGRPSSRPPSRRKTSTSR